jgi:MoxR-like ATPase
MADAERAETQSRGGAFYLGTPVSELYRDPAGYDPGEDLDAAVRVALLLGMPLLLTGEPGCGKTASPIG